jgi:hypothetical protein
VALLRIRTVLVASDKQIEQLRREAARAGDLKQVKICDRALHGSASARKACSRAIADAQAMRD